MFVVFVTHVPIQLYDGKELWFPGNDVHIDDKLVHCMLYSALLISAVLAWAEQMTRRWYIGCWEQRGLFVGPALIVLFLVAFDEATQPFCWRSCSVMDICADLIGIFLGLMICVLFLGPVINNLVQLPPLDEPVRAHGNVERKKSETFAVQCLDSIDVRACDAPQKVVPSVLVEISKYHATFVMSQVPTFVQVEFNLPTVKSVELITGSIYRVTPRVINSNRVDFEVVYRIDQGHRLDPMMEIPANCAG